MVSWERFEPDTAPVQAECSNHYAMLPNHYAMLPLVYCIKPKAIIFGELSEEKSVPL